MKIFFLILHMLVAVALAGLILMQNSKGGLGSAFGGGGEQFRTKRGAERVVFSATIVLVVVFLITSIMNLTIR
jgi:preprotein translocase subunit SecG